jgi:phosphoribosyl-ATP pyrophosphohydrolase/phosphoribosyl-AMP cyclohydrolase
MRVDCDADAILLEVDPAGPACHTGATSCFFESIDDFLGPASATGEGEGVANGESHADNPPGISAEASRVEADASPGGAAIVDELAQVIAERHATMPEGSYVAQLLAAGIDRVAKKVGEEAAETIIAAKNGSHEEIVWEVADLWFHTLVLLEASGVPVESVWKELARRRK